MMVSFLSIFFAFGYVHANYNGHFTHEALMNYEIVIPKRFESNEFLGGFIDDLDRIEYRIPINGTIYNVALWLNRKFVAPGMTIETHKIKNASVEALGNIDIRTASTNQCHYRGVIRGIPGSKAVLSNCNGVTGYLAFDNETFYFIEPSSKYNKTLGDEQPHILYKPDYAKTNEDPSSKSNCLQSGGSEKHLRLKRSSTPGVLQQMYLEVMIVLDKTLVDYHNNMDLENYILTNMNIAHDFYSDASFGAPMDISIARIIRLEDENDEMNLKITSRSEEVLKAFSAWQKEMNIGDDDHPNHHDVAVLITKRDLCGDDDNCALLGLAQISGTCDPDLCAAIVEDCGLKTGFVIAHEIGHTLGIIHDSLTESGCPPQNEENQFFYLMSATVSVKTQGWSPCSRNYLYQYIDAGYHKCLLDKPVQQKFPHRNVLPGAVYGPAYQCRYLINENVTACGGQVECGNMRCSVPGKGCVDTKMPLALGTPCGVENSKGWCQYGSCLPVGTSKGTDGGWGDWGPWSDCSRTCGGGISLTERFCDAPKPAGGGLYCTGKRTQYKMCNTEPCDLNAPLFRDVQCARYNNTAKLLHGEKNHQWRAYYFHTRNPCSLLCVNEKRSVVEMKPFVIDGTPCGRGERDVCFGGHCLNVPCDMDFESSAVEDACGVCNGDGLSCTLTHDSKILSKKTGIFSMVLRIPKGTIYFRIEEIAPTACYLQVRSASGKETYTTGKSMGRFPIPGGSAFVGSAHHKQGFSDTVVIKKENQEFILIKGPTTEELSVWVYISSNVSLAWAMSVQAAKREPVYQWRSIGWSACSSHCGPGTQMSEISCVEAKGGIVSDSYCKDTTKPQKDTKTCEVPCETRWCIGEWKQCEKSEQKRLIQCCRVSEEEEADTVIVGDSMCDESQKPTDIQSCETEDSEINETTEEEGEIKDTTEQDSEMIDTNDIVSEEEEATTEIDVETNKAAPQKNPCQIDDNDDKNIFVRMWNCYVQYIGTIIDGTPRLRKRRSVRRGYYGLRKKKKIQRFSEARWKKLFYDMVPDRSVIDDTTHIKATTGVYERSTLVKLSKMKKIRRGDIIVDNEDDESVKLRFPQETEEEP